jgi:hypothetical protein
MEESDFDSSDMRDTASQVASYNLQGNPHSLVRQFDASPHLQVTAEACDSVHTCFHVAGQVQWEVYVVLT